MLPCIGRNRGGPIGHPAVHWACTCHVHDYDCWQIGSHIGCWGCCRKKGVADCGWQSSHMAKPHGFAGSRRKQRKRHRRRISHVFFRRWLVIWYDVAQIHNIVWHRLHHKSGYKARVVIVMWWQQQCYQWQTHQHLCPAQPQPILDHSPQPHAWYLRSITNPLHQFSIFGSACLKYSSLRVVYGTNRKHVIIGWVYETGMQACLPV